MMGDYFTDKDLNERAATPCSHQYRRLPEGNAVESYTGNQIEVYRCRDCGKIRRVVRPAEKEK